MNVGVKGVVPAVWGAVLYAIPQAFLWVRFAAQEEGTSESPRWFLYSVSTVMIVMAGMFIGAFVIGVSAKERAVDMAGSIVVGAVTVLTLALFVLGPGDMWPLVVLQGAILCTAAIFAGIALGVGASRVLRGKVQC